MVFIPCSEKCIYQQDGCCTLSEVSTVSNTEAGGCIYKIISQKPSALQGSDSVTDTAYTNELQLTVRGQSDTF